MTLPDLLLNKKPCRAIISIATPSMSDSETYISEIARDIDTTYAHTVKIINKLESHDLIDTNKNGRKRIIEPNPRCKEIAESLTAISQDI